MFLFIFLIFCFITEKSLFSEICITLNDNIKNLRFQSFRNSGQEEYLNGVFKDSVLWYNQQKIEDSAVFQTEIHQTNIEIMDYNDSVSGKAGRNHAYYYS